MTRKNDCWHREVAAVAAAADDAVDTAVGAAASAAAANPSPYQCLESSRRC